MEGYRMFNSNEDFYYAKAYQLMCDYEQKRYLKRANFISELINYQLFFGPKKSIFNCELLLNGFYRKRTIELALRDLNYSLVKYNVVTDKYLFDKPYKQHTIVMFQIRG